MPFPGKSKLPAIAGAGTGAGPAVWPADAPGYVNTEPGLETPIFDPVDILTAPIGVPTKAGKAAAALLAPAVSCGVDKLGGLPDCFMGEKE